MKSEERVDARPTSFIERGRPDIDGWPPCTFEEFLEQASALIVGTDGRGKVRICSQQFLRLTGRSKQKLLGADLLGLFPESERMRIGQLLASALKGESGSRVEARLGTLEGKQARISLASSPLLDGKGRVRGMLAIGQDLSEAEALEHRLLQTEKLAFLGRFAASVAHEINNPLTAVVGCAETLLARSARGDARDGEKLRKILDGCERILRLTRQLVSYARPPSEKAERVQLHKLLDTALSYCDHVLSHHGITVEKAYQAVPEVAGIKANLAQVFVNLVTNACQAMQPGGILQVATARDGQHAVVRVSDNGPGMDAATLGRAFEPFFTTKPDGMGSGLGLFIARNIVESHRGEIDVRSSIGQGTTFVIRLPGAAAVGSTDESLTFDNLRAQSATI